jgi:hypothetical protein
VKDLQIRRGWLNQIRIAPAFQSLDPAHRQFDIDDGYERNSMCKSTDL